MASRAQFIPLHGRSQRTFLSTGALCLFLSCLTQCQLDPPASREEKYVTVHLNDSLKRFDSVEIVILVSGDTSIVVGKIWSGPLSDPASVPSFRLDDGENRPLAIRVRGFDSTGALTLNMLISRTDGTQTVADLPVPKPPGPIDTTSIDSVPVPADTGIKAWKYHRNVEIKINHLGMTRGLMVRNCPLLVRLNKDNFDFSQAAAGGKDIRFTSADGRAIGHEITRWDAATSSAEAEIWVQIDSLRTEDDSARVILHHGNPAAADVSDGTNVFGESLGFSGVWHLSEQPKGQADEFRDATGRFHGMGGTGDGKNLTARVLGAVGYGQEFSAGTGLGGLLPGLGGLPGIALSGTGQSLITLPRAFDPGNQSWTFQAWIRRTGNSDGVIFDKGDERVAGKQRFQIICMGGGTNQIAVMREGAAYFTNVYLPANVFILMTLVYNGAKLEIYVDGFLRESKAFTQGGDPNGAAKFGSNKPDGSTEGFTGTLDETWFSGQVRSPEWIRFEYETQRPKTPYIIVRPP